MDDASVEMSGRTGHFLARKLHAPGADSERTRQSGRLVAERNRQPAQIAAAPNASQRRR
jgi:hypothetical protein